jgi:hypothetical protein
LIEAFDQIAQSEKDKIDGGGGDDADDLPLFHLGRPAGVMGHMSF